MGVGNFNCHLRNLIGLLQTDAYDDETRLKSGGDLRYSDEGDARIKSLAKLFSPFSNIKFLKPSIKKKNDGKCATSRKS